MYKSKAKFQTITAVSGHQLLPPVSGVSRFRPTGRGRVSAVVTTLLRWLLDAIGNPPIRFILWDGEEVATSDAEPGIIVYVPSAE